MNNIQTQNLLLFQPAYMKNFSCIGPECQDNCCYAWEIRVDKKSFFKYKSLNEGILSSLFKKYLVENNGTYKIEHENNTCPFFDNDKLCLIHKNLGEDFLCDTCTIYPRTFNIINECVEVSAAVSCPEIARLVLCNKNGIDFEYSNDFSKYKYLPKRIHAISNIIDINEDKYKNNYIKNLYNIRNFCIDIIQSNTASFDDRLIMLGLFIDKIHSSIENNEIDKIPNIIEAYSNYIKNPYILNANKRQNSVHPIKITSLLDIMISKSSTLNKTYIYNNYFDEFLQGLNYTNLASIQKTLEVYNYSYNKYFKLFFDNHKYIFENYLVNYVFRTLFPLDYDDEIFKQYILLIINYSLLKLFLVGIASYHKNLNEDLVINVIQAFAKVFNHNSSFNNKIYDKLKESNLVDMKHASIFIMN